MAPLSLMAGSYMTRTPPADVLQITWLVWECQTTRATLASGAVFTSVGCHNTIVKTVDGGAHEIRGVLEHGPHTYVLRQYM